MSSQRGNVKRQRPQKHQNKAAFKNTLHDTSKKTKIINAIQPSGCCNKCKEIIEWKIKYKKYKLLSQPKKCVKCEQKTVKKNYCIICDACSKERGLCVKCGHEKEIAVPHELSAAEEASQRSQLENELKMLSERQRRAFHRSQESGKLGELYEGGMKEKLAAAAAADASDSESCDSDNLSDSCEDCENESQDELEPVITGRKPLVTKESLDETQPLEKINNLTLKQTDCGPCSSATS